MSVVHACTIASNNYLAFARVLAESYIEHHPGARVYVCIADRPRPEIPYSRMPFTTVFAHELGIPAFENFAFRYDILELNTAVKPWFLAHLRDRFGLDRTFYFDPDILIRDRLRGLEEALEDHQALLTPHITRPLDNELRPSERTIRQAGVYNLGFLGLRLDEDTKGFLEWWAERLRQFCLVDLHHGLFVDQSWMDLAPAFLEQVAVVRDPIYNLAYWNLPHRTVEHADGVWRVAGRPVGFFHFSGIDLGDLDVISRHQNRLRLRERPDLEPCFETYRRRVLEADHLRLCRMPYGYGTFTATEITVPKVARTTLRRVDPEGRRWHDPFDLRSEDSYYRWLVEPLEFEQGFLNRTTLGLWEERPDLPAAFPRPCDEDLPRFIDWLTRYGEGERAGLHPDFLMGVRHRDNKPQRRGARYSRAATPYDAAVLESARTLVETLDLGRPGQLISWLNHPVPGRARRRPILTYLSILIHQTRADLQRAFPDPLDRDQIDFALWFVTHAQSELSLYPPLVRPVRWSLPIRVRLRHFLALRRERQVGLRRIRLAAESRRIEESEPGSEADRPADAATASKTGADAGSETGTRDEVPDGETRGVNLAGYFGAPTGVGQMGRASARVLKHLERPFVRVPLDRDFAGRIVNGRIQLPEGLPYPVTLIHANADETPRALSLFPGAAAARSYKIGYWFWELAHFPLELSDRFVYLDEVWAPSRFCQRAYEVIASIPVRFVPPYAPPPARVESSREEFGLEPDRFYFFYAFDVLSVPERKNPGAAIEAIRKLQRLSPRRTGLLLKVSRAEAAPEMMAALRKEARKLPVVFQLGDAPRATMDRMLASCDAILSLHRSEGLGLLPIEGLYLDKPVVATDYGGVTDFLDPTTGYPVDYELERLDGAHGPYPAGSVWARPLIEHAVELMARVVERPEEASERAAAGHRRVEELYGLDAAGRRFASELERIYLDLAEIRSEEGIRR